MVENQGDKDRINLVIDVFVNKEINNCDRGNDQTKTIWGDLCIDNWSSKKIINYIMYPNKN